MSRKTYDQKFAKAQQAVDKSPNALKKLKAIQRIVELREKLYIIERRENADQLEADFVSVAKLYADSQKISVAAFRELGVPTAVLKQAGLS